MLLMKLWWVCISPTISFPTRCHVCFSAGGSSNEDLSDSTEVSIPKSHVKRRLRNFFAKRPTMDSLVKKGIYQGSICFNMEWICTFL